MNTRLSYLDSLKGLSIVFVILLHTLHKETLQLMYGSFHIGQAVPIFLTITFYLSYLTMDKLNGNVWQWYNGKRIIKMLKRVVLPFFVVLILQSLVLLYLNGIQSIKMILHGGGGMDLVLIMYGFISRFGY